MSRIVDVVRRNGAPVTVPPTATVHTAAATMAKHDVGATLVLDEGTLVGIFTERDLARRVVVPGLDPATTPVSDVMTRNVAVVQANTSHNDVMRLMQQGHFRHAPVAKEGKIVGVVSIRDLLRFEKAHAEAENQQLRQYVYAYQ
ncbi:MAG: CBS domain-containing protein [Bacteroidota bacterium]